MRSRGAFAGLAAALVASVAFAGQDGARLDPPPSLAPVDVASRPDVVALRAPAPDTVLVPGGVAVMGSTEADIDAAIALCAREPLGSRCDDPRVREQLSAETEAHRVLLSPFRIDRTEVTVAAYARCVAAGACEAAGYAAGGARFERPDAPVTLVRWDDAVAYCAWSGARLPTEAEWERAARGAERRVFPWGNTADRRRANHGVLSLDEVDATDGFAELAPVGSFRAGRTPSGIDDLAGNAAEWVADAVEETLGVRYPAADEVDPRGPATGAYRVVRGGSYAAGMVSLRGAARFFAAPSTRRPWIGFRCARAAAKPG